MLGYRVFEFLALSVVMRLVFVELLFSANRLKIWANEIIELLLQMHRF